MEKHIRMEDLQDFEMVNFYRRCVCFDINKQTMDYLFQKKSDYLLVSFHNSRFDIFEKENYRMTKSIPNFRDPAFLQRIGCDDFSLRRSNTISDEEWYVNLDRFCAEIQKHYSPNQIVLQQHYGVMEYMENHELKRWNKTMHESAENCNTIMEKLDARFLKNIPNCHVIPFPQFVYAVKPHPRSAMYLHYCEEYTTYAVRAWEIVLSNLSQAEEQNQLEDLKAQYETYFQLKQENSKLRKKCSNIERAFVFSKQLNLDIFGSQKVIGYFSELAEEIQSVALLKSNDVAGNIICKALEAMQVPVIYTTPKGSLTALTEQEWEQCKLADVILSAEVHSKAETERDGRKAFRVASLLEQAEETANN